MKKVAARVYALVIALLFVLAVCPAQAFAVSYPRTDQRRVCDESGTVFTWLNEYAGGNTIYYNESAGVLTLNNYVGGSLYLYMPNGSDKTLTIVLVGHNKITGHGPSVFAGIGFGHIDNLIITSSSGGSLTVNQGLISNESTSSIGIDAGSYLTIKGNAEVSVNVHSTAPGYVTGIRALHGLNVIEHASLSVYCSGNHAIFGEGVAGGGYSPQQIVVTTTEEVVFDLSDLAAVSGCTTVGANYQHTNDVFHFENSPRITFFCDRPAYYEQDVKPQAGYAMTTGTRKRIFERCEPMYRMYNQWTGEHLYTGSATERDNIVAAGWTYEGIGWYAPGYGDPVYRLYNKYAPGGDHHYTMSLDEYVSLTGVGWTGEGVVWYSDTGHEVPVYREYNPYELAHNHNYTANKSEHDHLVSLGWRNEGIGWYGRQTMQ